MNESVVRGVILRMAQFGEADRMASVLVDDGSRREVRVPQARRSRKRFGGLDLFVTADLRFGPNRKGRATLQECEVVRDAAGIRDDLVRAALAAHVAELIAQVAQEEHGSPDLYRLTVAALESLGAGAADASPSGWARGFELKLLHVLGARPSLRTCVASGRPVAGDGLRWSTTHGGVLMPGGPSDARSVPVTLDALVAMEGALRTPLADQANVAWPGDAGPVAERALRDFLAVHVGRRDRARRFLADVLGGLGGMAALLVTALLTGCVEYTPPASVRVQGWLYESPEPTSDTPAVSAATAEAFDVSGELVVAGSEPFSDAPGWYRFSGLPPSTMHHHVFTPPAGEADHPEELGHVATVIPGVSAVDDLYVDAGTFHLWPAPIVDGWRTAWELAGIDVASLDPAVDDGGIVRGQVFDPSTTLGLGLQLETADGSTITATYTDAAGAPDPAATGLSEDGGFFFGRLAPGLYALGPLDVDGTPLGGTVGVLVVEDAVTSLMALHLAP